MTRNAVRTHGCMESKKFTHSIVPQKQAISQALAKVQATSSPKKGETFGIMLNSVGDSMHENVGTPTKSLNISNVHTY